MREKYLLWIILFIPSLVSADDGSSNSLYHAFNQAWQHQARDNVFTKKEATIMATKELHQAIFPSSPELALAYEGDQALDNDGATEYDVSFEFPLWLPGQRDAFSVLSDAQQKALIAEIQEERWLLAGDVRESYWEAMLAQNQVVLVEQSLHTVKSIAIDVHKQVVAGALAEADDLLAQQEVLAAEAELLLVKEQRLVAQQNYLAVIGIPAPGDWHAESVATKLAFENHPASQKLVTEIQVALANEQQVRTTRYENPTLELGWLRERESREESYDDKISIGLKWPIGGSRLNAAELSEAEAESAELDNDWLRLQREQGNAIHLAQRGLSNAQAAERLAQLRQQITAKRFALTESAFSVGELGLRDLMLSRTEAEKAEQDWQQHRIKTAHAISLLNQALGGLPTSKSQPVSTTAPNKQPLPEATQ